MSDNGGEGPSIRPLNQAPADTYTYVAPTEGSHWDKLNLLSLDGGGIRGYWTLLMLEKLMEHIGQQEIDEAKKTKEEKPEAEKEAEKHAEKHAKGRRASTPMANGGTDRPRDRLEGTHSFWPQRIPSNVSQVPLTNEEKAHVVEAKTISDEVQEFTAQSAARRYLPCHYFDYICGSSTGALIAIMLGRLRMTVVDCIHEYETMGTKVFGHPRFVHQTKFGVIQRAKFKAKNLKTVIQDVTYRRSEVRDVMCGPVTFPTRPGLCKTFVTTIRKSKDGTLEDVFLIRSYRHKNREENETTGRVSRGGLQRSLGTGLSHQSHQLKRKTNFGEASDFEIWQVARAATAAPFYFKPLHVDLHPMRVDQEPEYMLFSDGGFGTTNNPTQEGVLEIQNLHGQHAIGVVVSIGTARGGEKFGAGTLDQVKNSYDKLTDPDTVHQNLRSSRNFADYYRLNAQKDNGLNVPMDEWKPHGMFSGKRRPGQVTLEKIRNHFLLWYSNLNNQGTLNKCAHQLVLRRRARLHDIHRWERFATGAHFYCSEINCEAEFSNRQDFMDHLMGHEKWDQPEDIEDDYLRRHTNYWEYRRPPTNG